jgi:outer membrane lipoprotein carrier protein
MDSVTGRDHRHDRSVLPGMRTSFAVLIAATVALAAPMAAQSARETPEALAARIQQRYDTIRDFEGTFSQSYEGGVLKVKTSESGTVAIKRPGRMRWVYTKPERKEFVSDGSRMYSYIPADKQVIVAAMPTEAQTTPALFLAGRGNLVRDFTPSYTDLPGAAPGLVALRLVPKRADPDLQWLVLGVDPATLQIRQLVAADGQGGRSTFTFSNLKENRNLSDKLFAFQIPRGVDVVTNGTPAK